MLHFLHPLLRRHKSLQIFLKENLPTRSLLKRNVIVFEKHNISLGEFENYTFQKPHFLLYYKRLTRILVFSNSLGEIEKMNTQISAASLFLCQKWVQSLGGSIIPITHIFHRNKNQLLQNGCIYVL